jgi:hypothetical protein
MTPARTIQERLRDRVPRAAWPDDSIIMKEAAAHIDALEAALKPFADYGSGVPKVYPDSAVVTVGSQMACRQLTIGDCRKAARTLVIDNG